MQAAATRLPARHDPRAPGGACTAIMPVSAWERQIGDVGIGRRYFTRSTRTLWLQPCTYISQLPRIIGLIVTSGLSTSGHEYAPDSACFQTWPLSSVKVVCPDQPLKCPTRCVLNLSRGWLVG